MRNIRSYLAEPQISTIQGQSYYRLKTTTGVTYGSKYKRRYGAKLPVNAQIQMDQVAGNEMNQKISAVSGQEILR